MAGRSVDGAPVVRRAGTDGWTWILIAGTAVVLVVLAYALDLLGGTGAVVPAPVSGGTGATR